MREFIIRLVIIGMFFYIISLVMEHKAKNFINEKHQTLFSLIMTISIYIGGFMYSYKLSGSYSMLINVTIIIAGLGGYLTFQRNRVYFLKKIDKKFIMENKSQIIRIIEDYKSKYTDSISDITFLDTKIIFKRVSKEQAEECLSIIGNFLDQNRKEYTFKDYLIYFIKGHLIPTVITIAILFLIFKIMMYQPFLE